MTHSYKIHISVITALMITSTFFNATAKSKPAILDSPLSLQAGINISRAQTFFGQGEITKAIATLESFVCPNATQKTSKGCAHPYLFFTLGNFYAALGKETTTNTDISKANKKAVQNYKSALKASAEFSEAWINLAAVCHTEGLHNEAANAFEKGYLFEDTPKAVHLYYAAVCYFQANNSLKALELFTMLERRHPDQITLAWKEVLVHVLFSLDRHKDALFHIETLANNPWPDKSGDRQKKWKEILVNQYLSLDMDKKALAYSKKLTRNDPLEPKWWKALSHVHLKHNQLKNGLSSLVVYSFLSPLTPDEKMLAADLYFSLNVPAKAADLYESLVTENQDHLKKTPLKKLIQARTMAHDPDAAIKWIEAALVDQTKQHTLTKKEIKELTTLKQQLIQIKKFYAAADQVLSPSLVKLHNATFEKE
ncbi:MAG: tetratricopeptide repeat protein [Desulfobacterales bacterium]|nr:tetratricopeptide repeat protein [Desulfobacterales bacterium]